MAKNKTVKPEETAPEVKEAQDEQLPEAAEETAEAAAGDVKADVEALEASLAEANGKADEYLTLA